METEEEIQNPAEIPAPDQEITATLESDETMPENQETEETPPKTFTQEELDAIVGKRLNKERRKWEREQTTRETPRQSPSDSLALDQFETPEAYAEALAERKAQELLRQHDTQRQRSEIESAYSDREEEAREKYDDFEQVAYNPKLRITQEMAETIKASEIGPEVAYHLGQNPKEAERISRLSPLHQAREIGKIEAKLGTNPPVKKPSSAPAPITPVNARGGSTSYDTTDPRSIKAMSTSEWIEAERQRQIKKYQAAIR